MHNYIIYMYHDAILHVIGMCIDLNHVFIQKYSCSTLWIINNDLLNASNEYVPKGPKYDMVPKRVATEPYMYQYHHSIFSEFWITSRNFNFPTLLRVYLFSQKILRKNLILFVYCMQITRRKSRWFPVLAQYLNFSTYLKSIEKNVKL